MRRIYSIPFSLMFLLAFNYCGNKLSESTPNSLDFPKGDTDNGGLYIPDGFEAFVVVDSIGRARHLAVDEKGDIYVKLRIPDPDGNGIVALSDTTQDGRANVINYLGGYTDKGNYGTAMRLYKGYMYFSTAGEVYRYKLEPNSLLPIGEPELILVDDYKNAVHGFEHIAKPIAFDNAGYMYVPFGSPGDVCQEVNRKPGSPGIYPCPQLEKHGGIWRFDANKTNQTQLDGKRYASGIRSVVAMDWNTQDNELYVVQHGRDDLHKNWPGLFSPWEGALLPSEEFLKVKQGSDSGWPYYYFDHMIGEKKLNPEYSGAIESEANSVEQPIMGFPGHFAPNDLHFYQGDQFPERYKNGAFIAFHGSTNRTPYPQAGYFVGFVPFENGKPTGPWEVFADGFAGMDTIVNTGDVLARPMGIAMGPDGSLYISESVQGKIYRIMFTGDKAAFGKTELSRLEDRKNSSATIQNPDEKLDEGVIQTGARVYNLYCGNCHQRDGMGDGNRFPPLTSPRVIGNKESLIEIVLEGMKGPINVEGVDYNSVMPAQDFLGNTEISAVLTYIRKNFGNEAQSISPEEVSSVRAKLSGEN